jgi:hypothetical protein
MQDNYRRWTRRRKFTLSDAIVWATWLIITAAGLLAFCILVTLIWPATP